MEKKSKVLEKLVLVWINFLAYCFFLCSFTREMVEKKNFVSFKKLIQFDMKFQIILGVIG